ncbi:mannonate dehydratase [Natronohydrobacter thiooxidans]|uniref:mannonate dehydratase n=1 Tax=Natronohydrobacter thiooxidans TaxID=87172 RepID=UPI0008FF59C5|nr:mannonate dehydratase [Natronohydrobacter thiooxidans]
MRHAWRWFGPQDPVRPEDIAQAGAQAVVSALHHVPNGQVWTSEAIAQRQAEVGRCADGAPSGLQWEVVESLPVSEDIKKQKGDWRAHIGAYKTSLEHLAQAGIAVICYNFMPVLDWTRTDLRWRRPTGARAMRFDMVDFAAFDIHLLQRAGAAQDFTPAVVEAAACRLAAMDDAARRGLADAITMGLPGSTEAMDLGTVRAHLDEYGTISAARLRAHFIDFLSEVVPVAERLGLRLCCHPDDPPFPLMGLPRIMSTAEDYAAVLAAVDSPANGMTLCSGSLGVRADNDLPAMMDRFGPRVHFLHLRNVRREADGSFFEDEHLEGETDMVALIAAILREEARRRVAGRADYDIPMRPDHGQEITDDLTRNGQPGYPLVGRLRGLAELRGVERALRVTGAFA